MIKKIKTQCGHHWKFKGPRSRLALYFDEKSRPFCDACIKKINKEAMFEVKWRNELELLLQAAL